MNKEYNFTNSDAWLLQTIARASYYNDANLKDIIALGDALNRAIFSSGELQQGFSRFLAAELIIWKDHRFSLSEKARKQMDEILKEKSNILVERDKISELINAKPWTTNEKLPQFDPEVEPKIFSLEDYETAIKEYREEFWKTLKEIEKSEKEK
jgi:hypothetical protein